MSALLRHIWQMSLLTILEVSLMKVQSWQFHSGLIIMLGFTFNSCFFSSFYLASCSRR